MAASPLRIRVWVAGGPAHTLVLPGPGGLIGRSRSAELRLLAPEVSGAHVRLVSREDGLWVEDLGSANGTRLDGAALAPGHAQPLPRGALLQIGPYHLSASLMGGAPGEPPADHGPEGTATLAAQLLEELVAAGACPPATVQVRSPGGVQHRCLLGPGGTLRIGRDPACDLGAADPDLSRHHAELRMTPAGAVVEDLGSKNGTYLGDERITGLVALRSGDRLCLGGTELIYEDPTEALLRELEAGPGPDGPSVERAEARSDGSPASLGPTSLAPASAPAPAQPSEPARQERGEGAEAVRRATRRRASWGAGPLLLFAFGLAVMAGALWALGRLFL